MFIIGDKMDDNIMNKVGKILKKNSQNGLSVTELVETSRISRSAVRTALAKLEGAKRVVVRKVGMAKVYSLKEEILLETKR